MISTNKFYLLSILYAKTNCFFLTFSRKHFFCKILNLHLPMWNKTIFTILIICVILKFFSFLLWKPQLLINWEYILIFEWALWSIFVFTKLYPMHSTSLNLIVYILNYGSKEKKFKFKYLQKIVHFLIIKSKVVSG